MRFGVPVLDSGLGDGPVLVRAKPGIDAHPFVDQAVRNHHGPVIYLTVNRTPDRVRARWRDQDIRADVTFLDAHDPHMGLPADGVAIDMTNPMTLIQALDKAARSGPEALLILDDLGSIAMLHPERFRAIWPRLVASSRKFAGVLAVATDWDDLIPTDFGDEVVLEGIEQRIITHEYFRVRRQGSEAREPILYRSDRGHVRAYVPKVVVTGPANAGKTTLIDTLCEGSVHTERKGTSVVGDRGTLEMGGIQVDLFGTPGQERFDPLLPATIGQAVGAILMVDAAKRDDFQRARRMLNMVQGAGRHVIVVANKQDQDGALGPEALATELDLTDETPVIGCTATDPASARRAVARLLEELVHMAVVA